MSARRIIEAQGQYMAGMIRAMQGVAPGPPPETERKLNIRKVLGLPDPRRCEKEIWWPTIRGGWLHWVCPGPLRHKGFHWDENYYPGYHDGDIDFFRRQYDILFGEDQ